MSNSPTPSASLEDPCEDLVKSHKLDYEAHVSIYTGLVENAGSRSELKAAIIQVREAQEADKLDRDVVQGLYQKSLSSPHNGDKKLDAWMKQMLSVSDPEASMHA